MKTTQEDVPIKSRLRALDVTKGFVMIAMATRHCAFFFSANLLQIPFNVFDPYVFSTFLLCFGIGNGLSRRAKKPTVLGKLLFVYLIGGLPSAVVTYLLKHKEASISMVPTIATDQLINAITLQNRLTYADFLVPFIVAFAFFLGLQSLFQKFNRLTLATALGISSIFYISGYVLTQIAPNSFFKDFYSQGFRCLQSIPIFITGICLGLFLREKGKMPVLKPQIWALITLTFFGLIVVADWQFQHQMYNGRLWKKSGELSYLLISTTVSILLLFVVEGIIKSGFLEKQLSLLIDFLEKIGERTMRCLWIQFLLFPIAGYLVSLNFVHPVNFILSLAVIGLMCWLTVDDRLYKILSSRLENKKN
ncbi:hypothetical protein [Calothrix sp. NIES-2098]|uniref:hypothetical protein n=1 Tax=Calothrix sp. NIES-2098 TaxID=1954171 RepID=UPI000B5FF700|nr:hypothetical protein NIES2098_01160 [Calothrix sp. NIES-2098]